MVLLYKSSYKIISLISALRVKRVRISRSEELFQVVGLGGSALTVQIGNTCSFKAESSN